MAMPGLNRRSCSELKQLIVGGNLMNKISQIRAAEGGFTILELMISAALLAIALTGVVAALFESSRIDENTRERAIAQKAAENMMEQIKAQPRNAGGAEIVDFCNNNADFDVENLETGNNSEGSIPPPDTSNPGYVIVTVVISWDGVMGPQNLSITRYLYVYG